MKGLGLWWMATVCAVCVGRAALGQGADDGMVTAGATGRAITYDDLARADNGYGQLSLSPDGNFIAYEHDGAIWIKRTRTDGVGASRVHAGNYPKWAPNGHELAFYASQGGKIQMWIYDMDVNTEHPITSLPDGIIPDPLTGILSQSTDGGAWRMSWSPDSSKIVFASRIRTEQKRTIRALKVASSRDGPLVLSDRSSERLTWAGVLYRPPWADDSSIDVEQLFVADTTSAAPRVMQLTTMRDGCFFPSWSPDGAAIACTTAHRFPIEGQLRRTDIVCVNARNGNILESTRGGGVKFLPVWLPDERHIAYLDIRPSQYGLYGRARLAMWTLSNNTTTRLAPQLKGPATRFQLYGMNNRLLVLYKEKLNTILASISVDGSGTKVLRVAGYRHFLVNFTVAQSGAIAWSMETNDDPGEIEFLDTLTGGERTIVDLNPTSHQWIHIARKRVEWINGAGEDLEGIVLEPPGFTRTKRYPTIVDAYPLTEGPGWQLIAGNRLWAELGYVVFIPAPRSPQVPLKDWSDARFGLRALGNRGWEVSQDDLVSGVKALVRRGIVDSNRICIYGHSNGGAVALNVIARTAMFACAVVISPTPVDYMTIARLEPSIGSWMAANTGLGSPYTHVEPYTWMSVISRVAGIQTPVLLAIGDRDYPDVTLPAIELYNSLRALGRRVTLLRYPDQGHVPNGRGMKDLWHREREFFAKYLTDGVVTRVCHPRPGSCSSMQPPTVTVSGSR